jgi:hypothetical protein
MLYNLSGPEFNRILHQFSCLPILRVVQHIRKDKNIIETLAASYKFNDGAFCHLDLIHLKLPYKLNYHVLTILFLDIR